MSESQEPSGRNGQPGNALEELFRSHVTRRDALRAAGGASAALMFGGLLAACGDSGDSTAPSTVNLGKLQVEAGTDIPKSTVRYGLLPYGDNSMPVIGMQNGWFEEVGITVQPQPVGSKVQDAQVVPKLVNDEIDMINWDGTVIIQTMTKAPDLKMVGFTDTYSGIYILAAPDSGAQTVADLVDGGTEFSEAMTTVMGQLVDKRVTLDNTGYHKTFFNTVFKLGEVDPSEFDLTTIDDAKMVQLAKAGDTDFCSPAGAAQNVELLKIGWFPIVGVDDLLNGLPPGDPQAVATLDHIGPALNQKFYEANRETVLRAMSVNFRIVDAIVNDPDATLQVQLPYLESVTGGSYTIDDIKLIYEKIDPPTVFDDQGKFWIDTNSPEYYKNVYNPQIESLQEGGVLPKDADLDASQVFLGTEVYQDMLDLKAQYEDLASDAEDKDPDLAAQAKTQADNRNYLDAVRFALAATNQ